MTPLDLLLGNLTSPFVLAFLLGMIAVIAESDLKFPESIYTFLSTYLLLSIGLKGGVALSEVSFDVIFKPFVGTLFLGISLPFLVFFIAYSIGKLKREDAASLAAHYGSVSAVTFIATQVFVTSLGHGSSDYMIALVAVLEVPAIIVGLLLAQNQSAQPISFLKRLKIITFGKSVLLLWGGILMGLLCGKKGMQLVSPFFVTPFQGVLVLFLLDMGVIAGSRLKDLKHVKGFLFLFAILMPLVNGTLGVLIGNCMGMSIGDATVLGAMSASASYIAAPAAVRLSLPMANPAYSLTPAIAITFPFNLSLGIPLYHQIAVWLS